MSSDTTRLALDIFHNVAATKTYTSKGEEQKFREASRKLGMTNKEHYANATSYTANVTRLAPRKYTMDSVKSKTKVIALSAEGDRLLVVDSRALNIYDTQSRELLYSYALENQTIGAGFVSNMRVFYATHFGYIKELDLATNTLTTVDYNDSTCQAMQVSTLGDLMLVLDSGLGGISLYNTSNQTRKYKIDPRYGRVSNYNPVFSYDGQRIAYCTAYPHKEVSVWSTRAKTLIKTLKQDNFESSPMWIALSHDGKLLACSDDETSTLNIWDVDSGELLHTQPGTRVQIQSLAFSQSSKFLYVATTDALDVYDTGSFALIDTFPCKDIQQIKVVPNQPKLIVVKSKSMQVWDFGNMYRMQNGGKYKVHTGTRGGKYIVVGHEKAKKYITVTVPLLTSYT